MENKKVECLLCNNVKKRANIQPALNRGYYYDIVVEYHTTLPIPCFVCENASLILLDLCINIDISMVYVF